MPQTDYAGLATSTSLLGTLLSSAGAGTVVTLVNATGWPTGASGLPFAGTFGRGTSSEEKILFSSRTGNNLTISQRGYDDTVAVTHQNGETVSHTNDATLLRTASAHIFDTTRDDHTQYARTNGARTITGLQAFSALPNTTHESNRVANLAQVYGRGFALATDLATHQGGVTAGLSISVNRADPAVSINNAGGDALRTYSGTTQKTGINNNGCFIGVGDDHLFGANAFGGAGTRVHLGSLGDLANAYVLAEGSATNVGLILKSKGTGTLSIKRGDDTQLLNVLGVALTGNQSALQVLFNTVGARTLELGVADSGGTGYRSVRVAN